MTKHFWLNNKWTFSVVLFIRLIISVNAQSSQITTGIITQVTPPSISCYGADYPRPHIEIRPVLSEGCLSGKDPKLCQQIGTETVFVNSTFKVGQEKTPYTGNYFYCAHERIIENPTDSDKIINNTNLNFNIRNGQTIPLCKNTLIPNCTIRICYPI